MSIQTHNTGYQAFRILQFAFIVVPIVVGLDKFFYLLTNWSAYLSPMALRVFQGHDRGFMMFVGGIEILAGIGVLFKPKLFAYIISFWILLVILNLLISGQYLDIIVRDFGLMLAAFALGKLSQKYEAYTVKI